MKPLQLFTLTLITVLIGFCIAGAQNRTTYSITDLCEFNSSLRCVATGINAAGRVTAYEVTNTTLIGQRGFLVQNGRRTNLAPLSNLPAFLGISTIPYSINDKGDLTGSATASSGAQDAFLWKKGWMDDIPTLSAGYGINIHDQIAGQINGSHAALFKDGQTTDLGTLGGTGSVARAINDRGQVVGSSGTLTGQTHAFLWQDGQMIDLNIFGSTNADALSINNHGQIVGTFFSQAKCAFHAFLWQGGRPIDLTPDVGGGSCGIFLTGTAAAHGINDRGQVVGDYATANQGGAFLWQNARFTNLNDVLPAGSGWVVRTAWAINRAGQIVGSGDHNGLPDRAFLMEPPKSADEDDNKEGQP